MQTNPTNSRVMMSSASCGEETPPTINVGAFQDSWSDSTITSGVSTTGASSVPPDYRGTWRFLTQKRQIVQEDAAYDGRFQDPLECRKIVNRFFSLLLRKTGRGGDSNDGDVLPAGRLVDLWNGEHEDEQNFNKSLLAELGVTLQDALRRTDGEVQGTLSWSIERVFEEKKKEKEIKMVVLVPRPRIQVSDGEKNVEVAMGIVREAYHAPSRTSTHRTSSKPDHAWAIFERPVPAPSSAAAGSDSAAEGKEGDENLGTTASATSAVEATTSGETAAVTLEGNFDAIGAEWKAPLEVGSGAMAKGSETSWNIRHILAVVDLKRTGAACGPFPSEDGRRMARSDVVRSNIDTSGNRHGPLAQVIMYTLSHALWNRAALGPAELPSQIPTAVGVFKVTVKGKKKGEEASSTASSGKSAGSSGRYGGKDHWVLAHLAVPEECGGQFVVGVTAFGNLSEPDFAKSSLAAYLHVMTSGAEAALEWLAKVKQQQKHQQSPPQPPQPALMSGRTLSFGPGISLKEFAPDLELLATPVSRYSRMGYRISQGELLRATLDLRRLKAATAAAGSPNGVFWCRENVSEGEEDEEPEVLIKVTSIPCFNVLVESDILVGIGSKGFATRAIVDILSRSLYGVYVTEGETGLVQILRNLRWQGYRRLRPKSVVQEKGGNWSSLWRAFENFISDTLIPLARADIVHPDIRAGFDETANLLYNSEKASIVMIDLDSLCLYDTWKKIPLCEWDKYLNLKILRKSNLEVRLPLDFVCLQVACIAEVWLAEAEHDKVDATSAVLRGRTDYLLKDGRTIPRENKVAAVLDHYRLRFAEKDGDRSPLKKRKPEE